MAASLLMVVLCVRLGLDQIVVGIAITLAGEGITSVLHGAQFGASEPRLGATPTRAIPLLDRIPMLGEGVRRPEPALPAAARRLPRASRSSALVAWIFRSTNIGLNLRAAGEKPEALDAAGVSVVATRSYAALATARSAGLGGAYLAIVVAGVFTPFITQGQGFMAIVVAMLARGRPLWVVIGSFLFGISISLIDALQLVGHQHLDRRRPHAPVPRRSSLALVLFSRRAYLPPALALPYVRGAR